MEEIKEESMKMLNYKSKLDNMLQFAKRGRIDKTREDLKSLLKVEVEKNKITEKEYNELCKYIKEYNFEEKKEATKIEKEEKIADNSKKVNLEKIDDSNSKFRNRVKVKNNELPKLDAIIMYKGEIGKVAPKNSKEEIDK